jgi:hypothetical protein
LQALKELLHGLAIMDGTINQLARPLETPTNSLDVERGILNGNAISLDGLLSAAARDGPA